MPSVATNTEDNSVKNETPGLFLDQNDAEVFAAVKNGDTSMVRSKLIDAKNPVDIDAINSDGETALQIATKMSNFDIIKVLLTNRANLYTALSQCVLENNLDCIKELLSERTNHNIVKLEELLIQAAELGHYDIVYFFLIRKYCEINEPHDFDCKEPCCRPANSWKEGTYTADTNQSKIAINRYKGLSSPVYMCVRYLVSNEDPLIQAFKLNTKVRKRANDEPELKKEYLKLSERCKTFAIDLYNGCRDNTEITALLGIDEKQLNSNCHEKLNKEIKAYVVGKLRDAINSTHIEFVAHPHNQQLLNVTIYSGVSKNIYRMPLVFKIPLFLLYTIIFPLLALLYIIHKKNRISRIMTTPYFKFISHISQFILFLCLIVASALRDTHTPSVLEYLIFITVVGMILQEGIEIYYHKPRISYFSKWWNIITAIMLILFVLAALFWIMGFAITGDWSVVNYSPVQFEKNKDGYQLLLLGNSFFSLAIVASIFYFFDLCQVNSVLGPLQLSLFRMLQDVLKFLLFFGAIFVAFAMGVRNLYSYYHSIQAEIAAHSNKTENTRAETNHPFSTFSHSTQSMFWALFDKTDLEEFNTKDGTFEITQETAKILFGVYSICAIVVALNMLIAMMGHSYDDISQDDDIQWKFSRTQLWLEFIERRSTLPAPYNLLAIPRFLYQKIMRNRVTNGTDEENSQAPKDEQTEEERRTIMKRLVRRYLRHSQESQKAKN